ncbi:hypothetical protein [Halarchaeum nitratireducens]|uniref:Uncharacterized protein n=1 Tax=Halarchaeum nitratireducens TaxID=489913 RepID=A0A830GFT2_9EURY|nr:hypothetical protein [Halarchaeum nitratireducens]GGN24738.1 hypothetical protein GCM10009021_28240 [Halarchaeum nitratireducens]
MTSLTQLPSDEATDQSDNQSTLRNSVPLRIGVTLLLFSLVAVEPVAAAQNNAVCSADKLPSMISGFFQLTTALGIVGLAVVWQADSLIDMFTLNPEQKKGLKRHKRSALKSTVILVVLGPLYTVAGSMMNLPLAQCVNLVPW